MYEPAEVLAARPPACPTAQQRTSALDTVNTDTAEQILAGLNGLRAEVRQIQEQLNGHRKDFLTVAEFGELVGRASYTVRRWVKEDKLRAIRVTGSGPRGRLLIPRGELAKLVDAGLGTHIPAIALRDQSDSGHE